MSRSEKSCIAQLIETHGKMEVTYGRTEVSTPSGMESCMAFLKVLQQVAETLHIDCASRTYREAFTSNYRTLFPDNIRKYHFDLFKASIEQHHVIYVNGDKFVLSNQTISSAEQLQAAWRDLGFLLKPQLLWDQGYRSLEEVRLALARLDCTWACFEQDYILELIEIEAQARSYITKAVMQEQWLTAAEESQIDVEQRRCDLVGSIARLNSVANNRRKGRDDLESSIIEEALIVQSRCDPADTTSAALALAQGVTLSFDALRAYLKQVGKVLERVDPHLCNNPGLVERLVDWEETWEVGLKYVRDTAMLSAVDDVVSELQKVQEVAPTFRQLCDECDVELFLCVPRIVWLRFLAEPAECGELLKDLLPHRFPATASKTENAAQNAHACPTIEEETSSSTGSTAAAFHGDIFAAPFQVQCAGDDGLDSLGAFLVDPELKSLYDRYRGICQQLLRTRSASSRSPRPSLCDETHVSVAWELLMRRVVIGPVEADALYDLLLPAEPERQAIKASVEALMLELERWSMELQRHSPQDWNQCSSVLIQCIAGTTKKPELASEQVAVQKPETQFHV